MRKIKRLASLLCCILALSLLITACGGSQTGETSSSGTTAGTSTAASSSEEIQKPDPFGKYDETIELTACSVFATWMTLDPGEDENNNWWTRTYLDKLNIKVTQEWTAPNWGTDFDQKFNVASASDSLPDILPCYTTLAVREIQNNKVWDMTQVYNDYASDQIKKFFTDDPNALKAWSVDGKLMGIPGAVRAAQPIRRGFWIRKDWLEQTGLPTPTTFAEVENLLREFVAKNPGGQKGNYGIQLAKELGLVNELLPVFGISERNFTDQGGQLVFTRTLPEMKNVWQKMADWYKEGLLSKNFPVSTVDNELKQDWLTNKVGVFEGATTGMAGNTTIYEWLKAKPDGDLVFVPYTTLDGKEPHYVADAAYGNVILVNKKCKYPEAVMKIINLTTAIFNEPKPDFITNFEYNDGAKGGWATFFRALGHIEDPNLGMQNRKLTYEALKTGDESILTPTAKLGTYDSIKAWLDQGQNNDNWTQNFTYWRVGAPGGVIEYDMKKWADNNDFSYAPYWGSETPAYAKNAQNWHVKYIEFCTQAILTGKVDEYFNQWLEFFKANGGEEATAEANAWYAENK